METPLWTPGPWIVEDVGELYWVIRGPDGFTRAQVPFLPNARLIAAVPELYETLEKARHGLAIARNEFTEMGRIITPEAEALIALCDSILAKARGEQ